MNYILFDTIKRKSLLPFTYVRPSANIRIGILTIQEKWEKYLNAKTYYLTAPYLQKKFPIQTANSNILINGTICPTPNLVKEILNLKNREKLISKDVIIAMHMTNNDLKKNNLGISIKNTDVVVESKETFTKLENIWDIFTHNEQELLADFELLTKTRKSQNISKENFVVSKENIFVENGATLHNVSLNASNGPIYIGKNTEIMEGTVIRGPFALCEKSVVKMGSKIYGATTIGPESKVGGELNNVVIFGWSNKSHEGFLGNSVIGEWCNIGAGSNNSNLKNTYEEVKLWDYTTNQFTNTRLQFCGLMMGDHSKCGINTMFNTGTVVGIHANIFGSGFQRNFIPSFSWGGVTKMEKYNFEKAIQVTKSVFARRNKILEDTDIELLKFIYDESIKNRYI